MRPYTTAPMFGSTRDVSEWRSQSTGWVSDVVGNGPDAKTDITDLLLRVTGFRPAVEAERGCRSTRQLGEEKPRRAPWPVDVATAG